MRKKWGWIIWFLFHYFRFQIKIGCPRAFRHPFVSVYISLHFHGASTYYLITVNTFNVLFWRKKKKKLLVKQSRPKQRRKQIFWQSGGSLKNVFKITRKKIIESIFFFLFWGEFSQNRDIAIDNQNNETFSVSAQGQRMRANENWFITVIGSIRLPYRDFSENLFYLFLKYPTYKVQLVIYRI